MAIEVTREITATLKLRLMRQPAELPWRVTLRRGSGAWLDVEVVCADPTTNVAGVPHRKAPLRYGYNTQQQRWAYGEVPPDVLLPVIRELRAELVAAEKAAAEKAAKATL